MGDTVTNQGVSVITNGTSHTMTTMGPTDVCKLPNGTPAPFPNFIMSQGNVQNGTSFTTIQGQPISTMSAQYGPVSQPAHPGVATGVGSSTYISIAEPTSGSPDLVFEGDAAVRTGDPTTQNDANTAGVSVGSGGTDSDANETVDPDKLCTIVKLVGKSGKRAVGPTPGKRGNEANYLELLAGQEIKFEVTREDTVSGAEAPACVAAKHTHWRVTTVFSPEKKTVEEIENQDKPTIPFGTSRRLKSEAGVAEVPDYRKQDTRGNQIKDKRHEGNKLASDLTTAYNFGAQAVGLVKAWRAGRNPPVATVEAYACSGSKTVTVKIFPPGSYDFDLFDDKIKQALQRVKQLADIIAKIADFFGQKFGLTFLPENAKLTIALEYKERTKDTPARKRLGVTTPAYYKVQVGRSWELSVGLRPIVKVGGQFSIPITSALPFGGPALTRFLNWCGIRADFFIRADLKIEAYGALTWDEYDDFDANIVAEIAPTFSAGAHASVRVAELTVSGYAAIKIELEKWGPRQRAMLCTDFKANVQFGCKAVGKARVGWFEKSFEAEWKPPQLKFSMPEAIEIPVYPWPV